MYIVRDITFFIVDVSRFDFDTGKSFISSDGFIKCYVFIVCDIQRFYGFFTGAGGRYQFYICYA